MPEARRVLVIKLSAFGNIVLSLTPFAAIRQYHAGAEISVLTTPAYAHWLGEMPYFDRVLVDQRPPWWDLGGMWRLRRMLRMGRFDRVYDLQTSGRSSRYLRMFPHTARPEWSGIAAGCSHPDRDPARDRLHDIDRQISQLRQAGLTVFPPPDLSWCRGDIGRFGLPAPFVLLVPGSSAHRPGKRWPTARYRDLAEALRARGMTPVVLGTAGERDLAQAIPAAIDLTGQTSPGDLTDLARSASFAVGNDTGPMHLLATAGCPAVVLFSDQSDPALCAPRGPDVTVLRRPDLGTLDLASVLAACPPAAA